MSGYMSTLCHMIFVGLSCCVCLFVVLFALRGFQYSIHTLSIDTAPFIYLKGNGCHIHLLHYLFVCLLYKLLEWRALHELL